MKKCSTCINMSEGRCRTMVKIPKEKFCYMTKEQAIKAEKDIISYTINSDECSSGKNRIIQISKNIIISLHK